MWFLFHTGKRVARLALMFALLVLSPAAFARSDGARGAIPLRPYVALLRTLDIEVGGQTARMIFDTGAGVSVLTPEFAARVGCAPFGRITAFRMTGERVEMQRCPTLRVRAGRALGAHEFGVLDIAAVLPDGLPPVDGVLGLDVFEGRAITIHRDLSAISIVDENQLLRIARNADPARVRLAREAGGAGLSAFVPISSPHGDLWVLLDSANLAGMRLHPLAYRALAGSAPSSGLAAPPVTIRIDGATPHQVTPEIIDTLIYDGALDANYIAEFDVTLDLANERIWWRR
jgi:hypothetical protein